MAGPRHPILYDLVRWRRYRLWLAVLAVGCYAAAIALNQVQPQGALWNAVSLAGTLCISALVALWLRSRFSYLRVDGDSLIIRLMLVRLTLRADAVHSVQVTPMGRFAGRRRMTRSLQRWADVPAFIIRTREASGAAARLARSAGRRFVWNNDLVFPVQAAPALAERVRADVLGVDPAAPHRPKRKRR